MNEIPMLKRIGPVVALQVEALRKLPVDGPNKSLRNIEQERREMMAVERTALLLGSFRKCDADDPEIFGRAIEDVLARYDLDIQMEVTRPGKWKFPPSAYELREACESISNERAEAKRWQIAVENTLAERAFEAATGERKALTYQPRDNPAVRVATMADRERREAEQVLARYKADAEASARPAALSVFELDPTNWDA